MARVCSVDFGATSGGCFTTLERIDDAIKNAEGNHQNTIALAGINSSGAIAERRNIDGTILARVDLVRQLQEEEEEITRQIPIQDELIILDSTQSITLGAIETQPITLQQDNTLRNALLIGGALLLIL